MGKPVLPDAFVAAPIAHRGLHDRAAGCLENTASAALAAIKAGYGIEIDVQLSSDGQAMVFHDETLDRLTGQSGLLSARTAADLGQIRLTGTDDRIPALPDLLALVAGRVPLLIEIKDQGGAMGPAVGPLEQAVARALEGYAGPVAIMSFNPHSVIAFGAAAPAIPRGLATSAFRVENWPTLSLGVRDRLRDIPDYAATGACFISHEATDLDRPRVADLKAEGAVIACWTIRSAIAEAAARRIADTITFEGYRAAIPA